MADTLIPTSLSQSLSPVLAGMLLAAVTMLLSGCATPVASSDSSTLQRPITKPHLPADWPEEVAAPQGFTLEFAVGGQNDGRGDFVAQYVTFGNQMNEVDSYIEDLTSTGFALEETREDLGIWILKGFGVRVEVVVDASYPNLTWLAATVS